MVRLNPERVLLIGDDDRAVHSALNQAVPGAQITAVHTIFDGIAELSGGHFTTVMAAAEPLERRAEAAVRTLRDLAGEARLLLFGHPVLEPLSRRMLEMGCDDYLVTPPSPQELQQVFHTLPMRLVATEAGASEGEAVPSPVVTEPSPLLSLPLAELLLDALLQHPSDASAAAIRQINERIGPIMRLYRQAGDEPAPPVEEGLVLLSHPMRLHDEDLGTLHLVLPEQDDETAARHFLAQAAQLLAKLTSLQERHNGLQKLAITDDLTGLYNGRYFRHFLTRIVEKARALRFPVTLLMFDIDNFKGYNDRFGHAVGDEILRQTGSVIKRSCRDHDLVARISGDEFAVVFWEKEGPRQPRQPSNQPVSRVPHNIMQILERFKQNLSSQEYPFLGPHGQGSLTISGGLAVYPYDAHTVPDLIRAADEALMFGAKQSGKNSIFLIGGEAGDTSSEI